MATTQLQIGYRSMFGAAGRGMVDCYLFANADAAEQVCKLLFDAAKSYHDKLNDRERMVSFQHLTGSAVADVSEILSIGVDDALGENRAGVQEWNSGVAEIQAAARVAAE